MTEPTTQDDGAFAAANDLHVQGGLSKLEYLATTAPETIPEWFEHRRKPYPEWQEPEVDEHLQKAVTDWAKDPCFDLTALTDPAFSSFLSFPASDTPELERIQNHYDAHKTACYNWRQENKVNRFFQWRVFYARRLLTELERG